jgi:hypothetical protein
MDLNDFWQENKRFLTIVAGGLLVFVVGEAVVGSAFGDELRAQQRRVRKSTSDLAKTMYQGDDLAAARSENEALRAAVGELAQTVAFRTRPEFALDARRGSASSQFFNIVARTREELLTLAGRNNLRAPDSVGLPALSPTQDEDIERHLEALDVIDRAVRLAVEAGVERIDRIDIKLDPALGSRQGVGFIERTRVELQLGGAAEPIERFLLATQAQATEGQLLVQSVEMLPSKAKPEEARLELTLVVARLSGLAAGEDPAGSGGADSVEGDRR